MKRRVFLSSSHREYRPFIGGIGGVGVDLPVIVTDHGVLEEFARYMYLNRFKSRSWQDTATFSIQLLLDYLEVKHQTSASPRALFSDFSNALFTGTIENYRDHSELWWQPRAPHEARTIIGHITQFSDWLSQTTENFQIELNPWRDATGHEQRLNWAAYLHKRENSFLSHLWRQDNPIKKTRTISPKFISTAAITPHKNFPDEYFTPLMEIGFKRRACDTLGAYNLRDSLIAYLMHYGGLRLSEALSLWCEDVTIENGEVIVRIFHPQYGRTPNGLTRAKLLQYQYGLSPRNTLVKANNPLFLGWKDCLITDPERCCFEVFFYPHHTALEFAQLWRDYHLIQRIKPAPDENHPYAFTNMKGQPYTHRMLRKAHKLGVKRIGLEYGKSQGTTPHGHRHAYGQRLARDGAPPLLIRFAMHHKSITSAETYTQPTAAEIRLSLEIMEAGLSKKFET